jgi:hypothetical protein
VANASQLNLPARIKKAEMRFNSYGGRELMSEISPQFTLYRDLLAEIKSRIRSAQNRAALSANAEMILLYWDIGRMIAARQEREGWGAGVIPRLAVDLKNELPEEKGFSETNLKRMVQFSQEYPHLFSNGARPVPHLPESLSALEKGAQPVPQAHQKQRPAVSADLNAFALLSWGHNIILIQKLKTSPHAPGMPTRLWSRAGPATRLPSRLKTAPTNAKGAPSQTSTAHYPRSTPASRRAC